MIGESLGPFRITARIGAGGMGEVYEAEDTRLGRTVAIKVLPESLAASPERRARFEREAKAVSQLAHPHVCTLHDVGEEKGIHFLVLEHCEGETLEARLERGPPLPLPEVLRYGAQIAEALDAAHRRGIVHRDLKPANVMLTASGVKLLDFGLARVATGGDRTIRHLTTRTMPEEGALTKAGTVLGTYPYMSPEQVEGKEADARSDLFSLGAVLYEMATGRRAFAGGSPASVMASVLREEPEPVSQAQPLSPPALDHVVSRCLAKDAERRWQHARDVALELRWIAEAGSQAGVAAPVAKRRKSRERVAWGLLAIAILTAAGLGRWAWRPESPGPPLTYLSFDLPSDVSDVFGPAISPDGRQVAYAVWRGEQSRLFVRSLDQLDAVPVAGAENVGEMFFSPDGRWLAYHDQGARELRRIPVAGGSPFTICEAVRLRGGDWGDDGTIVFSKGPPTGLWAVPATGGEPRPLTEMTSHPGEALSHAFPRFVPGGDAVVFSSWIPERDPNAVLGIVELPSGKPRMLIEGIAPMYSESGHLLFHRQRDSALVAVPFDLDGLEVVGPPTIVAPHARRADLSRQGTLVYQARKEVSRRLAWVGLDGSREPVPIAEGDYAWISIAPDGRHALTVIDEEIWLLELDRGTSTRLTSSPGFDHLPIWTPDGRSFVFSSDLGGPPTLHRLPVEGGEPERLTDDFAFQRPTGFTPDGRLLLFTHLALGTAEERLPVGHDFDLRMVDVDSRDVVALLDSPAAEGNGVVSPDGRWLAYLSDESGRYEVYLRSFPDLGGKRRVSVEGAAAGLGWERLTSLGWLSWGADGRTLLYGQAGDDGETRLMSVDVTAEPTLEIGRPRSLLSLPPAVVAGDIAPDHQRLLLAERTGETEWQIVVVIGWGRSMAER